LTLSSTSAMPLFQHVEQIERCDVACLQHVDDRASGLPQQS